MQKFMKELKKQVDTRIVNKVHERDESGRAVIHMTIRDDSDFLSCFSAGHTPVISGEVADFIETTTASLLPQEQITLKIHSNCIDEKEQKLYPEAIKEYYARNYIDNERTYKRNNIIAALLTMSGIAFLVIMLLLETLTGNMIWTEVIDIIAWVFLWEAADLYFLANRTLKVKRMRYLSYMNMTVAYCKTEVQEAEKCRICCKD